MTIGLGDLASAEGQILPFPIDFDGRPYNTLTLPCERVIRPDTMVYRTCGKRLIGADTGRSYDKSLHQTTIANKASSK